MLSGPNHLCSEETLELYALGRTGRALTARVEEHLLLCGECRQRLEELDEEVQAIRTALSEHECQCGLLQPAREDSGLLQGADSSGERVCTETEPRISRRSA